MALSVAYRSTISIFSQAILVVSEMDTNWTFNSSSLMMEVDDAAIKNAGVGSHWTWEEDKAFENALANYFFDANMWDKITLAIPGKTIEDIKQRYEALCIDVEAIESGSVPLPDYPSNVSVRKGKKKSQQARGEPWTEEEHSQFLYGLERFGRGDWKSIAQYSVRTKSNSQVASHAQKYFKRLNLAKESKRPSINDITTVSPEKLLAFEKATTSCMPGCWNEKSTVSGTEKQSFEEGATRAGKQPICKRPRKAASAKNQLVNQSPIGSSNINGKKPQPRHPKRAPTETENQLLQQGFPTKKARSDVSNQLLHGTSAASLFSDSGSSAPMSKVFDISSPPFSVEPVQEAGGPAPPVEMLNHPPSDEKARVQTDADVKPDGEFDISSYPDFMDLDFSLFPHFLD